MSQPQSDAGTVPPLPMPRRQRPQVVIKADLLPAVSVLSMVGLLGIPVGWLWSRLAPVRQVQVFPDGSLTPLPSEGLHRFDAVAIFALLCLAMGLLVGIAVWFLRERRGPVIMLAAALGSVLAAWLGTRMGGAFVGGLYPVTGRPEVGDVLARAPSVDSGWVLLCAPLATALSYGVLASWNAMDDLGRRLG